jgi:rare lipoprotein A
MLTAFIALCGCGHKSKVATAPTPPAPAPHSHATPAIPAPPGTTEEGLASWYGPPYHGRQAADGEIYDMEKLTAAHRTMPFNTWVHVTNLSNGRTVDVRITDRGPFVDGRIIDLSKAAARQIELLGPGVGPVRLQVISAPHPDTDVIAAKLTPAPNAPVIVGDF